MSNESGSTTSDATYGQELSLKVAKERLAILHEANDFLDSRAMNLTTLTAAIGAVAGSAKLLPKSFEIDPPSLLVIGMIFCSIRIISWAIYQLRPQDRKQAGGSTVDYYYETYIARPKVDSSSKTIGDEIVVREPSNSINQLIYQVCDCIQREEEINRAKSDSVDRMLFWLKTQMMLLITVVGWPIISKILHGMFPLPLPW